jgi:hypothetical protein
MGDNQGLKRFGLLKSALIRKWILRVNLFWVLLLLSINSIPYSQEAEIGSDTLRSAAPSVYIDCSNCDLDYFRTEITFINYVRDRKSADIDVLISQQYTGSGGTEYTVSFIGQGKFEGIDDTLKYISSELDTQESIRKGLARVLGQGLVRYVARTPIGEKLFIEYVKPSESKQVVDKWNYWVFAIELDTWFNGEKSYHTMNINGDVSARRVTEKTKTILDIWGSYSESRYDYADYKAFSLSRSKGVDGSIYWSLGEHWSAGYAGEIYSSIYNNKKIQLWYSPGIEYNFFPYSQSTRRILRLTYRAGFTYVRYEEETIFNKMREMLLSEKLGISLGLVQPWGSINTSLYGSHYFYDFRKNRLELYTQLSLKLFKGVSVNLSGDISRVHDQLGLRKAGASEEEVLLRRRELATSYSYWASFGVSYTFGSIYNNIVNPRFGN